jgi:hypothetical protein
MGKKSSPSRIAFKARRAERRANDPAVQERRATFLKNQAMERKMSKNAE